MSYEERRSFYLTQHYQSVIALQMHNSSKISQSPGTSGKYVINLLFDSLVQLQFLDTAEDDYLAGPVIFLLLLPDLTVCKYIDMSAENDVLTL